MTATHPRTLQVGERAIPVVLPERTDPRLQLAAVILTVHAIGITTLGFEVSVPQVLVAIVAAGLVDISITLVREGRLVWPASGMLTGSGGAGHHQTVDEAVSQVVKVRPAAQPSDDAGVYREAHQRYQTLYPALRPVFHAME